MTCCLRGECGHEPLREGQGAECTVCRSSVHPICSYELPANGNGIWHDDTLIHRRNLRLFEDEEDWTLCRVCASSIALAIAEDANDGRDGRFDVDVDAEVIAAVIHDSVLTAAVGNADNTDDDDSGDGESTPLTNVAVVTEVDEEEDDEEGEEDEEEDGELVIPAEVAEDEDVQLSTEDVKQLVSEFIRKARPQVMQKGCYRNHQTSSRYAQMLLKIKGMLDSNTFMTKHSFWYTVRKFFINKASFEYHFDRLASEIGVSSLTQLNIVPDPKRGSFIASAGFKLSIDGSAPQMYTKVGNTCSHALPNFLLEAYGLPQDMPDEIDPDPDAEPEMSSIETVGDWKPKFIVTLEKQDWMKILVGEGILKDEDIIIVNTQGFPTRNILACVHFLHRCYPDAPIVHGGDVGPTAVDLMLRFDYMKSTKTKFRVPIKWGFLRPSDVYGNDDVENALSGSMGYLTDKDKQADARVRNRECMQIVERLNELDLIRDAGRKYDMNDFKLGITGRLKDFVLQRLRNNSWV
eukprot:CAMPEP_0113407068 /NCGR_PEP_ID=MMETSP0013_2-20120614/19856_1 /TAXON_ID=2843 ORGANISM="Skeletonema costatum, Strain 1716" /NCGR_SAMPLE_ID=MMETSP0013_2 /ASSEMBLY_ACC=CAM_ASM_000158 /LENGTH=519 /DNA_ID=CAMNT_0000292973 /DNA_START=19 /DNA_END=1578 /DNA_ORIENTATION=- /assembly_acc=CAM_ASM_000158